MLPVANLPDESRVYIESTYKTTRKRKQGSQLSRQSMYSNGLGVDTTRPFVVRMESKHTDI